MYQDPLLQNEKQIEKTKDVYIQPTIHHIINTIHHAFMRGVFLCANLGLQVDEKKNRRGERR